MAAAMRTRVISRSELITWGSPDSISSRSPGTSPKCTGSAELRQEEEATEVGDQSFSSVDTAHSIHREGAWPHGPVHVHDLDDAQLEELWPRGPQPKAIFLDYDGTLREFEKLPELAVPTNEIHELLTALCKREDLLVHIISGRDADFLTTHFGAHPQLTLIAEHERRLAGRFQIWRPGGPGAWPRPPAAEEWKQQVRPEIEKFVDQMPGSHLEEKASALVWHHRGVANKALGDFMAGVLLQQVEKMQEDDECGPLRGVKVSLGHKTVEVSCRGVSKGEVMSRICQDRAAAHGPFKAVLAAGDDVSDESMFANAPQEFLTVKVGTSATRARFRVDTPEQLRSLLWRIASR